MSKFTLTRLCAGLSLALVTVAASAASASDTKRFIFEYKPGMKAVAQQVLAAAGGKIKLELIGEDAVAVEIPTKMLATLQKHAAFTRVSEDAIRVPYAVSGQTYLPGQTIPYGISMVQADLLSDSATGNRTLCIIDSGYDNAHEDLAGNNVTGEYDSGTGWWYTDENHHGSHVAGTIAAINNTGVGVVGVNPSKLLHLHIVKVFDAAGWAYSSTLSNAAKKCQAAGANVISMSLGGTLNNPLESKTFDNLYSAGILSIAASGNAGTSAVSYPAGYKSVVSIAAIDANKTVAAFSQFNKDVELAAPGVGVLSTVPMGAGSESALTVGSTVYAPGGMDGSPKATASGELADFGLGDVVNTAVAGKVCLISRGSIPFSTKVQNCEASGGIGAIVYNNVAGSFGGTLGGVATTIPSVTASQAEGASMTAQLGQTATIAVTASNYAYFDGTSMATPHASAVAALVWSYFPTCTNAQMRVSLQKSAMDLGTVGKDNYYGYGLIQAKAAYDRIKKKGCGL